MPYWWRRCVVQRFFEETAGVQLAPHRAYRVGVTVPRDDLRRLDGGSPVAARTTNTAVTPADRRLRDRRLSTAADATPQPNDNLTTTAA